MKATDYPVIIVWSKEDQAYLARVPDLPGCMADGETREEAVKNVLLSIEEWIETAQELERPIPAPLDAASLEANVGKQMAENQKYFEYAVQKEAQRIVSEVLPSIVAQHLEQAQSLRRQVEHGSYRGLFYGGGVVPGAILISDESYPACPA